jgi:hypothetical protein
MLYVDNLDAQFLSQFIPEEFLKSSDRYLHCCLFGSQLNGAATGVSETDFLLVQQLSSDEFLQVPGIRVRLIGLDQYCEYLINGDRIVTESLGYSSFSASDSLMQFLHVYASMFISSTYLQVMRGCIQTYLPDCYFSRFDLKAGYLAFSTAWCLRYVLHNGSFPVFSSKPWAWIQSLRGGKLSHDEFKTGMVEVLTDIEQLKYLIDSFPPAPRVVVDSWKAFVLSRLTPRVEV